LRAAVGGGIRELWLFLIKFEDDRLGERMSICKLTIATGVTVLLVPLLSACTSWPPVSPRTSTLTSAPAEPSSVSTPIPQSIAPPTATGTTLGTWVSLSNTQVSGPIDAKGEGLWIALDCVGNGSVTVEDSGGMSSTFLCTSDDVLSYANHDNQAHGESTVSVSMTGDVVWGLTISSTPLTDSTQG